MVLGREHSSRGVMESRVVGPWACRKQGSAPREEPACVGENLPHYTPIEKKLFFHPCFYFSSSQVTSLLHD